MGFFKSKSEKEIEKNAYRAELAKQKRIQNKKKIDAIMKKAKLKAKRDATPTSEKVKRGLTSAGKATLKYGKAYADYYNKPIKKQAKPKKKKQPKMGFEVQW